LYLIFSARVGTSAALAVELPSYVSFRSINFVLPNPDRPYEMVSRPVSYLPTTFFTLFDLEFSASKPEQLETPSWNAAGYFEFDSQYDIEYRAVVSYGLGPPHPITGFGRAHAIGQSLPVQWPFEPLSFETELVSLSLFGLSPIPEVMLRESPTLESKGITVVEDVCPVCASPLVALRISSFFDVYTEFTIGGDWSHATSPIRVAQYPAPTIPGDYNSDGVVSSADYVVWRNHVGNEFSLPNDDTPGVGADDYAKWKSNFGNSQGEVPGAGVPEPGTILLAAIGCVCLAAFCRR
jgi:hypothetical protein